MDESPLAQWAPLPWYQVSPPLPGATMRLRPRLSQLLDEAVARHPITLVAAASGYGKTSMLANWARNSTDQVAWLTLDPEVAGGEIELLGGMVSALRRLGSQVGAVQSDVLLGLAVDSRGVNATIEHITTQCAKLADPITLVVDNAGLAGRTLARGPLQILAKHFSEKFRFVLVGEPAIAEWFGQLEAEGIAQHIGAEDLAFTVEEVSLELALPGSEPNLEEATRIFEETGGWPIAVQLVRLGALTSSKAPKMELLTEFVASNILGELDQELSDFILAATTCSQLDVAIAQEITGDTRSAMLLEQCANEGIFLERFINQNAATVYRWHPLFAKHCRILLGRRDSNRRKELNRSAANALAVKFPALAMSHAIEGGSYADALHLLRSSWLRIIIDSGAMQLNQLCLDLTAQLGPISDVLLVRACCLDALGDQTGSNLLLAQAHAVDSAAQADPGSERMMRPDTQAFATLFLGHHAITLEEAVDTASQALGAEHVDAAGYAYRLFLLGWSELRLRRNPADAVRLLKSALREADTAGLEVLGRRIRGNLMFAYAYGGYFTAAQELIERQWTDEQGEADQQWSYYDSGIEQCARGFVDLWQGRLSQAYKQFSEMVDRGGHSTSYTALARVYLALCASTSGDPREIKFAESHVDGISQVELHGVPWPAYRLLAAAALASAKGDHQRAVTVLATVHTTNNIPVVLVLSADIYRRAGLLLEAKALLSRVQGPNLPTYVVVSALVCTAVIARVQGEREIAHIKLEQALDIAAPLAIALPFASQDTAVFGLLTEHAAWGTRHESFLVARLGAVNESVSRKEVLGGRLSARELEVFAYLRTTMTAEEIAAALFVSVNTVRTHQRSIYRKLGVGTRREAIKFRP